MSRGERFLCSAVVLYREECSTSCYCPVAVPICWLCARDGRVYGCGGPRIRPAINNQCCSTSVDGLFTSCQLTSQYETAYDQYLHCTLYNLRAASMEKSFYRDWTHSLECLAGVSGLTHWSISQMMDVCQWLLLSSDMHTWSLCFVLPYFLKHTNVELHISHKFYENILYKLQIIIAGSFSDSMGLGPVSWSPCALLKLDFLTNACICCMP